MLAVMALMVLVRDQSRTRTSATVGNRRLEFAMGRSVDLACTVRLIPGTRDGSVLWPGWLAVRPRSRDI